VWSEIRAPVVIAHRGDSAHAPENTLAAFQAAAQKGAQAVEFDVKLTSDRQVIVLHDQKVDRTTNGSGDVGRMRLAALQELDAGSAFSGQFRGERVPTLGEVFEAVGKHLHMNIELTNYATPFDALVPLVVDLVKKYGMTDRVIFSSFFAKNLKKAGELLPEVPRGLLAFPGWQGAWARTRGLRGDYAALHPNLKDVDARLVDRCHALGKRLNVWTVNAEADIRRMIGFGVDGIFTDDPALACRLLGRVS
jgi:glycerophosphoryl diester phosphodiesterase